MGTVAEEAVKSGKVEFEVESGAMTIKGKVGKDRKVNVDDFFLSGITLELVIRSRFTAKNIDFIRKQGASLPKSLVESSKVLEFYVSQNAFRTSSSDGYGVVRVMRDVFKDIIESLRD